VRRKLRVDVHVAHGMAEVRLVRWRFAAVQYATVAKIALERDDADERLAEARMKAKDMARQLNGLEAA
jgi:hypothetical protein